MNCHHRYKFICSLAAAVIIAAGIAASSADAVGMTSTHYAIQSDSVNFAGGYSASASYSIQDTLGEVATGFSSSTNYSDFAGYQQMQTVGLSVTPAANVTLLPSIGGVTGGTAMGSTSIIVTTDDAAGYMATIQASSSPALVSGSNYFGDYEPSGANPDFAFTYAASTSTFGFSPKGADITSTFLDNGSSLCGTGSSQTANACWEGLSTSPIAIDSRSSDNQPNGSTTTISFEAASGSSHIQPNGVYTATTTITVTAL